MQGWEETNKDHPQAERLKRGAIPEKQAFSNAMKKLQDSYYEAVGKPCGLLRDGPRKTRLSTVEYDQRKQSAKAIAQDLTLAEQAVRNADMIKETYQQEAAALADEKAKFDEGVKAIETLVTQLETEQAKVSSGTVQMQDPPGFIQRLFKRSLDETRTTSLFRRLFRVIVRSRGIAKTDGPSHEP